MTDTGFDPFEDRVARDVRNALSEALTLVFEQLDLAPARRVAEDMLSGNPGEVYGQYIMSRLESYNQALTLVREEDIATAWERALVLWDLGLFFEVHEILEHAWLAATGAEKQVLQAMIRAAGMYIKLHDQGNESGARKMAQKAAEVLEANRSFFAADFPLDLLLDKLRRLDPVPPKLRTAGEPSSSLSR